MTESTRTDPTDDSDGDRPPQARRRPRVPLLVGPVVVLAVVAGGLWWASRPDAAAPAAQDAALSTVPVTAGSMVEQTIARGQLHRPAGDPVTSQGTGVLTDLPAVGTVIEPGQTLYTVDTRPVVLLRGDLPAWRTLTEGMSAGEDVRQLEQALADAGLFRATPDTRFTASTVTAIRSWQRQLGVDATGTVERSTIRFAPGPVRVASLSSRLGADLGPGTEVFTTSGTDLVVDVDLDLDDQRLAVPGAAVTVSLPDGTALPATVSAVGTVVERPATAAGGNPKTVLPVSVALTDQAAAGTYSETDVTVAFTSSLGEDVLTVPVEALVPIDTSTFGVEVPDPDASGRTEVLPVTIGGFASGRVQVSGTGIVAGLDVVVPAS